MGNVQQPETNQSINENSFTDLATFEERLDIRVLSNSNGTAEIEVRGIDAPVANAIRRVLIDNVE